MNKSILYLIPRFTTGGAEKLVLSYAKLFHDADYKSQAAGYPFDKLRADKLQVTGYRVYVASLVGGGEMAEEFSKRGIEVLVAKERSLLNLWRNWKMVREWVRAKKPKIIHSHIFSSDVVGYLLKRKFREIKWISTQHNVGCEHSFFRKIILRQCLKKADKVIAVSKAVKKFCLKALGLSEEKVAIVANGVELGKWLAVPQDNLFADKILRLAIIGRLEGQKGHKFLFEALAQLEKINWQLRIFGAGSLECELKNLAERLGIEKRIKWEGVRSDLPEQLKNIDAVIQPSLWEGMSLVVMEAMAAGRLVFASLPAGEGLIKDKETGLIVPAGDFGQLAEAIRRAWNNKEDARKIALTGREWARDRFGIEKNIKEIEEIYEE